MNVQEICGKIDHTILQPECTWEEVKKVCEEAVKYRTATACIPPSFVKSAAKWRSQEENDLRICTVVGFPNGYQTTSVKCFETEQVLRDGADEVDMVIHIGWVKEKKYTELLEEIRNIRSICGEKVLKVIIETCLLNEYEKIKMCDIVSESGADFIKTSTGFSKRGGDTGRCIVTPKICESVCTGKSCRRYSLDCRCGLDVRSGSRSVGNQFFNQSDCGEGIIIR